MLQRESDGSNEKTAQMVLFLFFLIHTIILLLQFKLETQNAKLKTLDFCLEFWDYI